MNLGFSQKFKDGKATHFVGKIWNCLMLSENYKQCAEWYLGQNAIIQMNETLHPKLHTIREDKKNRWSAGKLIHFIINNRQPNRFQFAPVITVVSTQKIEVIYTNSNSDYPCVKIDGKLLYIWIKPDLKVLETLAKNDGFNSVEDFFNYFDRDFSGKIIHWTNLKY